MFAYAAQSTRAWVTLRPPPLFSLHTPQGLHSGSAAVSVQNSRSECHQRRTSAGDPSGWLEPTTLGPSAQRVEENPERTMANLRVPYAYAQPSKLPPA